MKLAHAAAAAIATAATVLVGPGSAVAQEFTMKISAPVAPTTKDVVFAWMTEFEKGVEQATNGRIDVQLYPANQLGQLPAAVEGVALGTIETTFSIIGFLSALDPRYQVLDAAGLFDSETHAMKTLNDPSVREMLSQFGAKANTEPLVILLSGQSVVVSKTAIDEIADFGGLKIRTGGATPLLNRPLEALGAAPVPLPLGEVLPALQTGAIDASTANMAVINAFKFQDVATEATYLPGNFTIVGGAVSKEFLTRIGPDLEAVVREVANKTTETVFPDYVTNGPAGLEALWTKNGGTIRNLNDDQAAAYLEAVGPVIADIVMQDAQMQKDFATLQQAAEAAK